MTTNLRGSISTVTSKPNTKLPEILDVVVKLTFSLDRSLVNLDRINTMMGQEVNVSISQVSD
jgi:hypothetical protein